MTNPTRALERSHAVEDRLADLRGPSRFAETRDDAGGRRAGLPVLGRAPDFTGTQRWFNTPAGAPLHLSQLRGRVVLVDFWTYTCINCIRTLPYVRAWDERYRRRGLTVVGVHTPEFPFERDADNVQRAIAQNGLRYPVAQDNDYATWNAWGNQYWPAKYLIDARGRVRYAHFGEGDYAQTESAIRALLAEAGAARLGAAARAHVEMPSRGLATPGDLPGLRARAGLRHAAAPRPGPLLRHDRPAAGPLLAVGHLEGHARVGHRGRATRRSTRASPPARCSWCWARPTGARARRACCSTAARWPSARRART